MIAVCIKQHVNNCLKLNSYKKLNNTQAEFKKSVAYKKSINILNVIYIKLMYFDKNHFSEK